MHPRQLRNIYTIFLHCAESQFIPWTLTFVSFHFHKQKCSISKRKSKRKWQIANVFNWLFLPGHWRLEVCCHGSGQAVSLDIRPCLCPGDCWIISAATFSKPHCCHEPLVVILNCQYLHRCWVSVCCQLNPQRCQLSCSYIEFRVGKRKVELDLLWQGYKHQKQTENYYFFQWVQYF